MKNTVMFSVVLFCLFVLETSSQVWLLFLLPVCLRSSLQSLHKACEVARCHNYYPGSLFLTWVSYYQSRVSSNQFCVNEWNAMQDVESHRANSPVLFTDLWVETTWIHTHIHTQTLQNSSHWWWNIWDMVWFVVHSRQGVIFTTFHLLCPHWCGATFLYCSDDVLIRGCVEWIPSLHFTGYNTFI